MRRFYVVYFQELCLITLVVNTYVTVFAHVL